MWGWEYEDWYRGVGDWNWSEGELVTEAQTYDFDEFGFVHEAIGHSDPERISTAEVCWFLNTGPSSGGYYNEATGRFYVDGQMCVPWGS